MRESKTLIGLPIISVTEGEEVGRSARLVIDPKSFDARFLVVEDKGWHEEAKLLPYAKILGVTEVIMIEKKGDIEKAGNFPEAKHLLEEMANPSGLRVITRDGVYLGTVEEFFLNVNTGKITAFKISDSKNPEKPFMSSEPVITLAKVLIVESSPDKYFFATPENVQETAESESGKIRGFVTPDAPAAPPEQNGKPSTYDLLVGKTVAKTIILPSGEILINEGETITNEIIERAKQTDKILELSFNIEA